MACNERVSLGQASSGAGAAWQRRVRGAADGALPGKRGDAPQLGLFYKYRHQVGNIAELDLHQLHEF